ncbi:transmembrane channel-like protein 5 [Caerostris extrusa]|uniref:Transmembrane channel-like protein 5 n=1 Tax=Caerostris extrusa TaxID=172846 RepID=A0AAV4W4P3_CAEEX|nr:transmembrane channel-like protein 5 [Caerostris extrusa]
MAKSRKTKREEEIENRLQNFDNKLQEDEYGYVDTKGKKASSALLLELPSRHLEDILVDEQTEQEKSATSLRRRDSHYRKVRLRHASLNYHKINIGAEKNIPDFKCRSRCR